MANKRVAYCTGFWCTNIGNGFFSLGVEYVLKKTFGAENVTIVSDLQTYTTGYGKRLYPDKNQLEYISKLDVDYIVLAGPVLSKFFLRLWKDILLALKACGIGYILLSVGTMKMDEEAKKECKAFFQQCPPYAFSSRDENVYREFGEDAKHAYNGICFSFFVADAYSPSTMKSVQPYLVYNFDKIGEPNIWIEGGKKEAYSRQFDLNEEKFCVKYPRILTSVSAKTDRFTDAFVYALSILPAPKRSDKIGQYSIIRTDHRFHPHYRSKIYRQKNSFCADLPYGYLNIYANAECTLSDRVHACAATLAYGNSAMLFAKTDRIGLLDRVGATEICNKPVKLDLKLLQQEKQAIVEWITSVMMMGNEK